MFSRLIESFDHFVACSRRIFKRLYKRDAVSLRKPNYLVCLDNPQCLIVSGSKNEVRKGHTL